MPNEAIYITLGIMAIAAIIYRKWIMRYFLGYGKDFKKAWKGKLVDRSDFEVINMDRNMVKKAGLAIACVILAVVGWLLIGIWGPVMALALYLIVGVILMQTGVIE